MANTIACNDFYSTATFTHMHTLCVCIIFFHVLAVQLCSMFTNPQEAQRKAKAEKQAAAGKGPPSSGVANKSVREGGGSKSHGHGHGGQATVGGEEQHTGAMHHPGSTHQHKPQTALTQHHMRMAHTEGGKGSKSKSQVRTHLCSRHL